MSRIAKAAVVALGTGAVMVGGAGLALADANAGAAAVGSPGLGSGNVVQVPVSIPINLCGNTVNAVGLLNPAFGNTCANVGERKHGHEGHHEGHHEAHEGGYGHGR
ncbi:chaplin [Streptomyces griseoluteus]|uniref:chaplin n=1 Tax=Streptomyces griseoluteus TaxID=29306 RepID=UPI0033FB6F55